MTDFSMWSRESLVKFAGEAQAMLDEQQRTIEALMCGMPEDGTTPVIRRIAQMESDYKRLMDKHNALHINALAARDEIERLRAGLAQTCAEPVPQADERTAFEAWVPLRGGSHLMRSRIGGQYTDNRVAAKWSAWVARSKLAQATERPKVDCKTCVNRAQVDGLSEETHCEHCVWEDRWRTDHYAPNACDKPTGASGDRSA